MNILCGYFLIMDKYNIANEAGNMTSEACLIRFSVNGICY